MSGGVNYVHRRVNIQILLIGRHVGTKTNITKLFGVKNILFDDAQSYIEFKSSCRLSQSVKSHTREYSLVSSAKLTSFDADTSLSISEIIIKNRRGPKTVPCGTPLNTGWSSLIPPGNRTKWDLSVRKWNNQIPIFPVQLSQLLWNYAKGCHGLPYQKPWNESNNRKRRQHTNSFW